MILEQITRLLLLATRILGTTVRRGYAPTRGLSHDSLFKLNRRTMKRDAPMAPCTSLAIGWVGSRAQLARTAKERGLDPGRIEPCLGPDGLSLLSSAERYDKFDIWNVIADNQIEREWFADLPPLHLGMDIKALSGIK
jgi:hypothetical protein